MLLSFSLICFFKIVIILIIWTKDMNWKLAKRWAQLLQVVFSDPILKSMSVIALFLAIKYNGNNTISQDDNFGKKN